MIAKAIRLTAAAALTLAALLLTACGSSSDDNASTSSSGAPTASGTSSSLAAEVPAAIKKKGTLKVASDATYPPNEFLASDGHTVEGWDAELIAAIANKLGLKAEIVNATFDNIIPGLQAGKYDLGASSFTDSKEREKVVDFVTYFTAGTSFFVKADGPTINALADLCGHLVAAEKGTVQAIAAQDQSKKCETAGKPAVKVLTFPDQNGANLALSSGRAEVGLADSPVVDYQVKKSNGQFKVTGEPYDTAPYGLAIPKQSGLVKPIRDALKELIADGTYKAILEKWGVEAGAISEPQVDPATS